MSNTMTPTQSLQSKARSYTIATLVTEPAQYEAMQQSFIDFGFRDCEFLKIDNTGEQQTCAYNGLNHMLNQARGDAVILCHQDVRLFDDSRMELDARLDELDRLDPSWAVAGNAGGVAPGQLALRITDPHGADQDIGDFPSRVSAVDENFIVVRGNARIGFSQNLSGFHFSAADICMMADAAGHSAYVIDFHLAHLSAGKKDASFDEMETAFREKWSGALGARWIQTTCSLLYISGEPLKRIAGGLIKRPFERLSKHRQHSAGWK